MKTILTLILFSAAFAANAQSGGGIFEVGPTTNHAKIFPISTMIDNNTMVSFGGRENGFISSVYADVYSASENVFEETTMEIPRDAHCVVAMSDESYMIIGGGYDLGVPAYANVEIYTPSNGVFTAIESMNYARMQCGAAELTSGDVLVAGGWYQTSPATYAEVFQYSLGTFMLTEAMYYQRAQPTVIPTTDGGAVVACGWGTYGSPSYTSYEYYDATTNEFTLVSEELIAGETGWKLSTPWTRPITDCKLGNGHFIFLGYRQGLETLEYGLIDFDPDSHTFSLVELNQPLAGETVDGGFADIVIDDQNNMVYAIGFDAGVDPQAVAIVTIDLETGDVFVPSNSFQLPAAEYFYASYTWLPAQGKIMVQGINESNSSYFTGSNKTYLITPTTDVSVPEFYNQNQIEMVAYPNPAADMMTIEIKSDKPAKLNVKLVDMQGREVIVSQKQIGNAGIFLWRMDIADVPNGMYQLVVYTDDFITSETLVIE